MMAAWNHWFQDMGSKPTSTRGAPVGKSQDRRHRRRRRQRRRQPALRLDRRQAPTASTPRSTLAKGCPILTAGGSVEVTPVMEM